MHSSTSSSDSSLNSRMIALLLAVIVGVCLCVEMGSRFLVHRISRIEGRIFSERQAVLGISSSSSLVLLGNSLMIEGVRMEPLQKLLERRYQVSRFVVENTSYLDWYYGLKRLLEEGAKPSAVVLMLSPQQWISDGVRGEYFARRLMASRDLPGVADQTHSDRTTTASYGFAHFSEWLGTKSEVRKIVLAKLIPNVQDFVSKLGHGAFTYPPSEQILPKITERFRQIQDLARAHSVKLVLVLPPSVHSEDPYELFEQAAREVGVELLVPVKKMAYPESYFSDGFHLNEEGARRFTTDLAAALLGNHGK